jgi:transposase
MPKSRPPYPPEFRRQIIELVRAGRTPEELAREFEPSAQTIRNWLTQADRDEGRRSDGLSSAEREELKRLRRENKILRQEKEILKKAAAWFARESN